MNIFTRGFLILAVLSLASTQGLADSKCPDLTRENMTNLCAAGMPKLLRKVMGMGDAKCVSACPTGEQNQAKCNATVCNDAGTCKAIDAIKKKAAHQWEGEKTYQGTYSDKNPVAEYKGNTSLGWCEYTINPSDKATAIGFSLVKAPKFVQGVNMFTGEPGKVQLKKK